MGDYQAERSIGGKLKKFENFTKTPFFVFSKPYLNFIGKEKLYSLIFIVMAIVNIILPFGILAKVIDSGFFKFVGAKHIFAFIFAWLVIVFACLIGFQLWLERKSRISNNHSYEFIATMFLSEIIQTFGEWIGTFIGIVGAGVGIISTIFLGNEARFLFDLIGMGFLSGFGVIAIIAGPVIGFFMIILFRFIAEQMRLFVSLVNNTKEIASNVKK